MQPVRQRKVAVEAETGGALTHGCGRAGCVRGVRCARCCCRAAAIRSAIACSSTDDVKLIFDRAAACARPAASDLAPAETALAATARAPSYENSMPPSSYMYDAPPSTLSASSCAASSRPDHSANARHEPPGYGTTSVASTG